MHAMLLADKAICLWLHRVQMKIRWDVMKVFVGDDTEGMLQISHGKSIEGFACTREAASISEMARWQGVQFLQFTAMDLLSLPTKPTRMWTPLGRTPFTRKITDLAVSCMESWSLIY